MASDFKSTHGNVNSGVSDERPPMSAGTPESCCTDHSPKGERVEFGPGPGIGANGRRIS